MLTAGSPVLIDGVLFDRRVSCRTLGDGVRHAVFECRTRPCGRRLRVFHHRVAGVLPFRV